MIRTEIKNAQKQKPAQIILKMNSLSDEELMAELREASKAGVDVRLIIRGIFCLYVDNRQQQKQIEAVSIVDEYLEHARVWFFKNGGKEKIFISSADWMVRNLDHRVEASCPIYDERIKQEIKDIFNTKFKM